MKKLLPVLLIFLPILLAGQVDAARQIDSLINLSKTMMNQGKSGFAEALKAIETAETLARNGFGEQSTVYAKCRFQHGRLLDVSGKMDEAEPIYQEVKAIQEKTIGRENAEYAATVYHLASVTKDLGYYPEAEALYLEALRIKEKTPGKEHPDYARTVNFLANLYRATGEYDKAEPLCLESMRIRERVMGKENSDFAWSLNSLANVYTEKGDFDKAEPLYLESMAIRERVLGKDHPNYSASMNNLGFLYVKKRRYDRAEALYLEAKERRERVLGKEHPAYAVTLNNLAELYFLKQEYDKVEPLYQEAKDIQASVFGKDHPDYALSLDNLARLYLAKKEFIKAEAYYLEARDIRQKVFGKDHPDYAGSLFHLAGFYASQWQPDKARAYFLEYIPLVWNLVNKSAQYSSEAQQNAYLKTFNIQTDQFYAFAMAHPDPAVTQMAFSNALFFNGYLLENSRLLLRACDAADSLTRATYMQWQEARRKLAKRYARPVSERKKIAAVEQEAEALEKNLLHNLPAFEQSRSIPQWETVRNALKPGETAIEFVRFQRESPKSIHYAALMVKPGAVAPEMIPLFEEGDLEKLLHTTGEKKVDYVETLYSVPKRGLIVMETPRKTLFELIWKPLMPHLKDFNTLYFAPAGLLHRINLGAVAINQDSIVADRFRLIGLGSTRQLASTDTFQTVNARAELFGGIQFDMDSTAILKANENFLQTETTSRGLAVDQTFSDQEQAGPFRFLKGSVKEINALAGIVKEAGFTPKTWSGFAATEEAVKFLGTREEAPRVLHLATHGYFFPDPKDSVTLNIPVDETTTGFIASSHPLIRSGLAMAGANYAWSTGKSLKKGMENGILTAYEISHLNLQNTELVVLSACETGLGDIEGNEGVYGLQRSFKLAGAKYLIMSLWKVQDYQTQELMTAFYRYWLLDKQTIPEAFRSAQLEMRERYENPYFWAGFVLME
jgi:CHAT domain-containing protein